MARTKRYRKKGRSRRIKRGGRKNNMALQMSQMMGGQSGGQLQPQPQPAPALTLLGTLDEPSVIASLQSFGEATRTLKEAITTGYDTVVSLESAVDAQKEALTSLRTAANSLDNSVTGTNGVFEKIIGSTFVAAPVPSPRPAPQIATT